MSRTQTFGIWLRSQRQLCGLTQRELAERVGCDPATIYHYETARRRPSKTMATKLADALGLLPPIYNQFIDLARASNSIEQDFHTNHDNMPFLSHASHNGMNTSINLSSFVGRATEIADLSSYIMYDKVRLLTLAGAPGVGKTRLAQELIRSLSHIFPDGAFFIPLAPITNETHILPTIAHTIGVAESSHPILKSTLIDRLKDRTLLLVLDSVEHLPEARHHVAFLLTHTSKVTILVTSQNVLHIPGEHIYVINPLPLPNTKELLPCEDLLTYESITLFMHRTQAIDQQFTLTTNNAPEIVDICTKLDGLPLAIELAAAQMRLLSLPVLLRHLDTSLACLSSRTINTMSHHHTLYAAIARSYQLLDDETQALFRQLGVFVNGCTIDIVEHLLDDVYEIPQHNGKSTLQERTTSTALSHLGALIDHHLLQRTIDPLGEPRLTMLETLRMFALEQLAAHGEMEMARQRHANCYLLFVETAQTHFNGPEPSLWMTRCSCEIDNVRTALQWAVDTQQVEILTRMSVAMSMFWRLHGLFDEARTWFGHALIHTTEIPRELHIEALHIAGLLALVQDDYTEANQLFNQSLTLHSQPQDQASIARTLIGLGQIAYWQGDSPRALQLLEKGMAILDDLDDQSKLANAFLYLGLIRLNLEHHNDAMTALDRGLWLYNSLQCASGIGMALSFQGRAMLYCGSYQTAAKMLEESTTWLQKSTNTPRIARNLIYLGRVALGEGRLNETMPLFQEGLILSQKIGDREAIALALEGSAGVAIAHHQLRYAVRLKSVATMLRQDLGAPPPYADRAFYQHLDTTIQTSLPKEYRHTGTSRERMYFLEQGIADIHHLAATLTPLESPAITNLTQREVSVLRLVAQGLSNAAVAEQLVISPRTVNAHLTTIYSKLGVTSRGQAIRIAIEQQLT